MVAMYVIRLSAGIPLHLLHIFRWLSVGSCGHVKWKQWKKKKFFFSFPFSSLLVSCLPTFRSKEWEFFFEPFQRCLEGSRVSVRCVANAYLPFSKGHPSQTMLVIVVPPLMGAVFRLVCRDLTCFVIFSSPLPLVRREIFLWRWWIACGERLVGCFFFLFLALCHEQFFFSLLSTKLNLILQVYYACFCVWRKVGEDGLLLLIVIVCAKRH